MFLCVRNPFDELFGARRGDSKARTARVSGAPSRMSAPATLGAQGKAALIGTYAQRLHDRRFTAAGRRRRSR